MEDGAGSNNQNYRHQLITERQQPITYGACAGSVLASALTTLATPLSQRRLTTKRARLGMSKQVEPENPIPAPPDVDSLHGVDTIPIAKVDKNEPIVTRRELWAYYRLYLSLRSVRILIKGAVYYNGDNV